jgi:Fe2+ or Zn2+ uptake regulation protein
LSCNKIVYNLIVVVDPDQLLMERLRDSGHRATAQRLIAYRVLKQLNRHVTAEEVLTAVADRMPNVALPTIYATLELLEQLGLIRRIATVGGTAVYDPVQEQHHHLLCSVCRGMEDMPFDVDLEQTREAAAALGFHATSLDVVVRGVCKNCYQP